MDNVDGRMLCHPIFTGTGEVVVRPICHSDAAMVQDFISELSGSSRYLRFFQPLKRLPRSMLSRLVMIDHRTQVAIVGVAQTRGSKRIVGEARYCATDDGDSAEIAIVVADEWQRLGIGTGLLKTIEHIAVANAVTRLSGETFCSNEGALSLAHARGFEIRPDPVRWFVRIEKCIGGNGARFLNLQGAFAG